ncbi:hypothetical protein OROGR_006860 [Orobanche gracilis]
MKECSHLPRKMQLIGTHMLTPTHLVAKLLLKLRRNWKKQDPNQASPSRARVYFKSRKHKEGRKYKTNRDAIKKRIETIDEVLKEGGDADEGSLVLVGGDPGIGKSTLLLQLAALIAKGNDADVPARVLYVSGEEVKECTSALLR